MKTVEPKIRMEKIRQTTENKTKQNQNQNNIKNVIKNTACTLSFE